MFERGGGAAFHDYFCPPFGPERGGGVAALKWPKITLFGNIFRPKGVATPATLP